MIKIFLRETYVLGRPFGNKWVFRPEDLEFQDFPINGEKYLKFCALYANYFFMPNFPLPSLHVNIHVA